MKNLFEKNVNGTRDLYGKNFYQREYVINTIKEIYKLHGFLPLETPVFEHLSTLLSMYGEESSKLIYKVLNSGDFLEDIDLSDVNYQTLSNKICKKGLRYDLTVPLMRFVSNNLNDIIFPFKRYQIQPVFRADRPQKGRFREFYQCDADIVGSESLFCEVELLSIAVEVFKKLKIDDFTIKINDRKILIALTESLGISESFNDFCTLIDKLDKVDFESIEKDLRDLKLDTKKIAIVKDIFKQQGNNRSKIDFILNYFKGKNTDDRCLESMKYILSNAPENVLNKIEIDFSLARGLAYYTGTIFEVKINNVQIGSVVGGGRYHKFAEKYENPQLKSIGMSFGIDRLIVALNELNLFPDDSQNITQILIIDNNSNDLLFINTIAKQLRGNGLITECYLGSDIDLRKQLKYANKKNVPFVIIVNEEDFVIKNMHKETQESFPKSQELGSILKSFY